ncbi:MAG: alpha/beta hydrolase [Planctomycetes bacterium]|nr:alpha/beta hydrolase [Planctomycetota bacterium]
MSHPRHALPDGRSLVYDWRPISTTSVAAPSSLPPVAFFNGLSQTTVAWGLQAQRLKGRRGVLLHDAAGQGKSDTPPDGHRPPGHARDFVHLLDALGIAQVDAVGFSYGSRIALRLALQAPERVRKLVLVGCAHRDTVVRRWIVRSWLDAVDAGGLAHAFRVITPTIVGNAWLERNEGIEAQMLQAFTRRNSAEGMRRLLADTLLPGGGLGPDDLRRVTHPTLVIRGEEDLLVSRALSIETATHLPNSRFAECEGAGHTVAIEAPAWFSSQLDDFLV